MGLFSKFKKTNNSVQEELQAASPVPAIPKEEHIECDFVLRDDEKLETLRLNKEFELSTQDLIDQGYLGKKVYRFAVGYKFGVVLVPEPTNQYDKNAVMVTYKGKTVTYIPMNIAPRIRNELLQGNIESVSFTLKGGPYRKIHENGKSMAHSNDYDLTVTIKYK